MKYTFVLAALAVAVTAIPTQMDASRRDPGWFDDVVDTVKDGAEDVKDGLEDVGDDLKGLAANLCSNIRKCVVALAPAVISCASAAATEGFNPLADAACIAGAINAGVNPVSAMLLTEVVRYLITVCTDL